jgi:hypothetical protein
MTENAAPIDDGAPVEGGDAGLSRGGMVEPVANDFQIPEAYADKDWTKNVKSMDDMFSQFDNAQSLIGKKNIPTEESSPEEWGEFYNKMGRPEEASGYEFTLPEGVEAEINEEEQLAVKGMMHELGLNQKQAQRLFEYDVQRKLDAIQPEMTDEELDVQFDEMAAEAFGDKKNAILKQAKVAVSKMSQANQDAFAGLDNQSMVAMAGILSELVGSYTAEDGMPSTDGSSGTGQSLDEVRSELSKLTLSDAARDVMHPDHRVTANKINDLRAKLQKLV